MTKIILELGFDKCLLFIAPLHGDYKFSKLKESDNDSPSIIHLFFHFALSYVR